MTHRIPSRRTVVVLRSRIVVAVGLACSFPGFVRFKDHVAGRSEIEGVWPDCAISVAFDSKRECQETFPLDFRK